MTRDGFDAQKHTSNIVFILSLVLLGLGIAVGLFHRSLNTEMAMVILLVCFSLSLSSALMLFHFLTSTASVEKGVYKIGGAAAGFVIVFSMLYVPFKNPAIYENKLYSLANSKIIEELYPFADSYSRILINDNQAITSIAKGSISKTRQIFNDLGMGLYRISPNDLPIYLMPMIDGSKSTYYATQYVLPEKFWEQLWAQEYFQKNINAVKERKVDLRRIFVLNSSEAKKQKEILDELMSQHIDNGINIRIVFKDILDKPDVNYNLRDFVVSDDEITGALVLNREGGFSEVEFSTDEILINRRISEFLRLWAISISYDDWKKTYYSKWLLGEANKAVKVDR